MPQLEKTLHGDIDEINRKIAHSICSNCPNTKKRGSWETTMGDVRCIVTLFEKYAPKVYVGEERERPPYPNTLYPWYSSDDYKDQPHFSLTVTLLAGDGEVRLFAITAGSGQETYFIPYSGAEGELMDTLNVTLNILDRIIL